MAATLDVVSEGRLELGIGAGWMRSDYVAAGWPTTGRVSASTASIESIAVLKGLFAGEPFTFTGTHFNVHELVGVPATVQAPHPPLLIGGGGPRMLRFAGREADIAGINANLAAGDIGGHSVADVSWERMAEKVGWVREGADTAGRAVEEIELSMAQWLLHVTDDRSAASAMIHKMASRLGVDPTWLEDAPGVLVGSPARCAEKLHALRDRLGISYVQVHAGPGGTISPGSVRSSPVWPGPEPRPALRLRRAAPTADAAAGTARRSVRRGRRRPGMWARRSPGRGRLSSSCRRARPLRCWA